MIVYVKPIQFENIWHEIRDPEQLQHLQQPKQYEVLYDSTQGKYDTGLTDEQRKKFEEILKVDLNPINYPDKPHPFFSTRQARIILPYRTSTFNTDVPLEALKIHFMKRSPFVANSLKEYKEGKWPEATHYIYDERSENEIEASRLEKRNKCIIASSKLNKEETKAVVQILSNKSVNQMSDEYIAVEIDKIIERNPDEFLKFSKMDKKELTIRGTILQAVQRNILIKDGLAYTYMGERLAGDIDELVTWFDDPQNQVQKIKILEKLQA